MSNSTVVLANFDRERFYCKNLIHDCYEVVGFQNTFLEVCEILSEYLKNNTQKDQVEMLCQIEAILQAAKIVIKERNHHINIILFTSPKE